MTFLDKLKDSRYKKIIFIEMSYVDLNLFQKKEYFSDYIIDLPEGLVDGGELFNPEPRLLDIPFFLRSIDLFDGKIQKGSYTIKIENTDGKYNNFFKDNYFNNSKINFYITLEGLDIFEKIQIAECSLSNIILKDSDQSITLKLDEMNIYQKNNNLSLFNYEEQDPSLEGEYKPFIAGHIKGWEIQDYNLNISPKDDFKTLTGATADFSASSPFAHFLYFTTDSAVEIFRSNVKKGDQILLPNSNVVYTVIDLFPFNSDNKSFNKRILLDKNPSLSADGDIRVKISDENVYNYNNKFLISSNQEFRYEKTQIAGDLNNNFNYINISDDWSFLEEGDIIFVAQMNNFPIKENITSLLNEEFVVDYYDKVNKRIFIKEHCPIALFRAFESDTPWFIVFDKVQKITINETRNYIKNKNLIRWDLDGVTGSDFIANSAIPARVEFNGIEFEDSINGTEIVFREGGSTISISVTTNQNIYSSSSIRVQVNYPKGTKASAIKTALDSYLTANPGAFSFTTTILDSNIEAQETNSFINQLPNGTKYNYEFPLMIEGAYNNKNYLHFNIDQEEFAGSGISPKKLCIYFNLDGETSLPTPPSLSNGTKFILVNIDPSDNNNTVISKILFSINGYAVSNGTPLVSARRDNSLFLKFVKHSKFPLMLTRESSLPGEVSTIHSYIDFFTTKLEENGDLTLEIDKKAYNMAEFNYLPTREDGYKLYKTDSIGNSFLKIAANSFVSDFDNFNKLILDENANNDEYNRNSTILVKNLRGTASLYHYTNLVELKNNQIYLNKGLVNSSNYTGRLEFNLYKNVEIEDIAVDFKENAHISKVLNKLFSIHNITNFSSADLDYLEDNYKDFQCSLVLENNKKLFESLKSLLISFNLYTFLDKEGIIRIKFFNYKDSSNIENISFYEILEINREFFEIKNSKVSININKNYLKDSSEEIILENEFTKELSNLINLDNVLEIKENNVMRNYFSEELSDLFVAKYLFKNEKLNIVGPLELIRFELGDNIKLKDSEEINEDNIYKVASIETNGSFVKLEAIRIIENPQVTVFIVDEEDNLIVDENDDFLIE